MVRYCTYKWLEYLFSIMLLLWVDIFFLMTASDALGCKLFEL